MFYIRGRNKKGFTTIAWALILILGLSFGPGTVSGTTVHAQENQEEPKENSWRYIEGEPVQRENSYSSTHPNQWKKIDGHYISNDGSIIEGAKMKGMDVSSWNEKIDWAAAKADGIEFAIIRCGFSTDKTSYDDKYWEYNTSECERLGIPYGAYLYSYAESVAEAKEEADHTIRLLKGRKLSFPVYYDLEDECVLNTGKATIAKMASAYLSKLQDAGYNVGIYSNLNWWRNYLTDPVYDNSAWSRWLAQWNSEDTYDGPHDLWQATNVGRVKGVGGGKMNVDLDFSYLDPDSVRPDVVRYTTYVGSGWRKTVTSGKTSGTIGKMKPIRGLKVRILRPTVKGSVVYNIRSTKKGWLGEKQNMTAAGPIGASETIDAIKIRLTGELADKYDIYYRTHVSDFGWLGWTKNGKTSGTRYYKKQIEAVQIRLVAKGGAAPGSTSNSYKTAKIKYRSLVEGEGWMPYVFDGIRSGTVHQAKKLLAIRVTMPDSSMNRYVKYRTRFQSYGWGRWVTGSKQSGRPGSKNKMEAVQLQLTGKLKTEYDVYYRVHVSDYGWLGWAKNGQSAGAGGKQIEAIRIRLVRKGYGAPGSTAKHYILAKK